MNLTEFNLFGVYLAPISVMMIVAWVCFVLVRKIGDRLHLSRVVWHPALFGFALYVIVLSSIVLLIAG